MQRHARRCNKRQQSLHKSLTVVQRSCAMPLQGFATEPVLADATQLGAGGSVAAVQPFARRFTLFGVPLLNHTTAADAPISPIKQRLGHMTKQLVDSRDQGIDQSMPWLINAKQQR